MTTGELLTESITSATAPPGTVVRDRFGRTLRYVRISVTDLCNLSCQYCNPVKGCVNTHHYRLSWDDLEFMVDVCVRDLGVEAIRITGGEPTVRPGLEDWIARINAIPGLQDIAMTTNGILLDKMAGGLHAAGLRRVNVSLDTFNEEKFREVTRGGSLKRCLDGIEKAQSLFDRVKLNCVVLRDVNAGELEQFVRFSHEHRMEVRFIELMPIFNEKEFFHRHYISVDEIKAKFASLGFTLVPMDKAQGYGPASSFTVFGTDARVGFISQMSDTKCLSCNKLRITADGSLKACLLSPEEVDLTGAIHARDRKTITEAMRFHFLDRAERFDLQQILSQPVSRAMQAIGG